MKEENKISLINLLNEYLADLEIRQNTAKVTRDILDQGIITLKINEVVEHLNILKDMSNQEIQEVKIWNSTPDNICWVLDDDREKVILYLDLGENLESGRYLTICGNDIPNFIDNKKFDYCISNHIFLIENTYNMELTQEEVELIKKHRN